MKTHIWHRCMKLICRIGNDSLVNLERQSQVNDDDHHDRDYDHDQDYEHDKGGIGNDDNDDNDDPWRRNVDDDWQSADCERGRLALYIAVPCLSVIWVKKSKYQ